MKYIPERVEIKMVCEINYEEKEMSLSEYIKSLCEFENVEALFECVKTLKDEKSLDEIKQMEDEEMLIYFLNAEKKIRE